jgi:L-alanine-DL-glutamate epimerase-like enolase superfamily enzyme
MKRRLGVVVESWPVTGSFTIARGSRTEATVVVVTILADGRHGRGEGVPYKRYGESVESVVRQVESMRGLIEMGGSREALREALPAGAARNALDCALWDLEAKQAGVPAHVLAGIDRISPVTTCFTISLGEPAEMAAAAIAAADHPILKIKLGGGVGDPARLAAVRAAAPDATLIVDANEGWSEDDLAVQLAACIDACVDLIEQPLPVDNDAALADFTHPIPICADESVHIGADLGALVGRYEAVNLKLDKTGGLTEALQMLAEAERLGLGIMVGCMLGTSLGMAPALLLTPRARFVDLDGPLLLAEDRRDGLIYKDGLVFPASPRLWG